MSGRSTADIAADLVQAIKAARLRHERYVADCNPVDELDEHGRTQDMAVADRVLAYIRASLPDCPRCGGTGTVLRETIDRDQGRGEALTTTRSIVCPDCDHGKVTVAQMAALWRAVHHEPACEVLQSHDAVSLLVDLRHAHEVRP